MTRTSKIIYFGCIAIILALTFGVSQVLADNEIAIQQVAQGDNLELDLTQEGYNNDIFFSIGDGDNISVEIVQKGNNNEIGYANDYPSWGSGVSWGGDIDFDDQDLKLYQNCTKGAACNKNDIQFHISYGTDNKLWWAQGYEISSRTDTSWSIDNTEGGGHNVTIDIHGSNNEVVGQQRNCSNNVCDGHSARIYLYGDDNSVFGKQKADGGKEFYLTVNGSDATVDYLQDGTGEHNATITITGSQPTTLDLSQHSNTTQNYSLSQNCVTSGGCNITVTQD
jgi:VCBS repeat-containing protein